MRDMQSFLPLLDVIFLTLFSVLAIFVGWKDVKALPVDLARIGSGLAVRVEEKDPIVVALQADGTVAVGAETTSWEELATRRFRRPVLVRVDRAVRFEEVSRLIALLRKTSDAVRLEVEEADPSPAAIPEGATGS